MGEDDRHLSHISGLDCGQQVKNFENSQGYAGTKTLEKVPLNNVTNRKLPNFLSNSASNPFIGTDLERRRVRSQVQNAQKKSSRITRRILTLQRVNRSLIISIKNTIHELRDGWPKSAPSCDLTTLALRVSCRWYQRLVTLAGVFKRNWMIGALCKRPSDQSFICWLVIYRLIYSYSKRVQSRKIY